MGMIRKIKWAVMLGIVAVGAWSFSPPAENYFEIAKNLDIFATLFKEVNTYYVDEVNPGNLVRQGIVSMLESLDPYTDFIAEEDMENFRIATTGQYAGIGALISQINNKVVVTHPYKNFPAYKAGVQVGDEIVAVNGQNTQGKTTAEVSAILKGQAHTDVEVIVRRYGQQADQVLRIKREKIKINNLAYTGMITEDIGYLKLDDFTTNAGKEVGDAISKLKQEGAQKIVLDLRDNPGGLMHEAVNIVNLFMPRGVEVVSTKGKLEEWNKSYKTLNAPLDITIPLVVLISEGSASASEIVSGALQDYDRAVLVGSKTFGKGLVQTTRQLSYNTQLKVTTAKYYIPSGRCIQRLDYAHRKEDGTIEAFADSTRTAFITKSGRIVYDGGGLDPDIAVQQKYVGSITASLFNSGLIFEYATRYTNENKAPADFRNFIITDQEYEKFVAWVKTQKFTYTTSLETEVNQLTEAGKNELFFNQIEPELKKLNAKIEENKTTDFQRFKSEIRDILSRQIAFHYALNEGQVKASLMHDEGLAEAIKLLNNPGGYKKILTP
jgi:carboxyl-terminal processing protease